MPLLLLNVGEHAVIKRIGGKPEVKQHLSDLGFIVGASILVVSKLGDNLIVNIKNIFCGYDMTFKWIGRLESPIIWKYIFIFKI